MLETQFGRIKPIVYVGLVRGDSKLLLVDYKRAPNPAKTGWWIPAPDLEFGEDPHEKATAVVTELGFSAAAAGKLKLVDVESFVLPGAEGAWHLLYHFVCRVEGECLPSENIRRHMWVDAQELEALPNLAHGKWEAQLGRKLASLAASEKPENWDAVKVVRNLK